jgi:hypothetical protein
VLLTMFSLKLSVSVRTLASQTIFAKTIRTTPVRPGLPIKVTRVFAALEHLGARTATLPGDTDDAADPAADAAGAAIAATVTRQAINFELVGICIASYHSADRLLRSDRLAVAGGAGR